jgi:hypothetical protein
MTTLAQSLREKSKPWQWIAVGLGILLIWVFMSLPELHRAAQPTREMVPTREVAGYAPPSTEWKYAPALTASSAVSQDAAKASVPANAGAERKIIRTSSLDMVVQHPAEVTREIAAMAESMGGYLESSNGGGQNATSGTLAIRVPASRFEQAQAEIRKLGLRVEAERVDAQDVTRQYVDQDARIRNLRAEEAGFLLILKQATTVKDMLAVSERLSEVRGQIEQQQAEFNALSKQIEMVSIAISLRTEPEPQVLGLNWRPGYQLKLALHDGLESVATYATTMTAVLFYLPATLLWVGTILFAVIVGYRVLQLGKRWLDAKSLPAAKQ